MGRAIFNTSRQLGAQLDCIPWHSLCLSQVFYGELLCLLSCFFKYLMLALNSKYSQRWPCTSDPPPSTSRAGIAGVCVPLRPAYAVLGNRTQDFVHAGRHSSS